MMIGKLGECHSAIGRDFRFAFEPLAHFRGGCPAFGSLAYRLRFGFFGRRFRTFQSDPERLSFCRIVGTPDFRRYDAIRMSFRSECFEHFDFLIGP